MVCLFFLAPYCAVSMDIVALDDINAVMNRLLARQLCGIIIIISVRRTSRLMRKIKLRGSFNTILFTTIPRYKPIRLGFLSLGLRY